VRPLQERLDRRILRARRDRFDLPLQAIAARDPYLRLFRRLRRPLESLHGWRCTYRMNLELLREPYYRTVLV